jgi:hypothetical protein
MSCALALTPVLGRRLLVSTRTCASCTAGTFQSQADATACQSCTAGTYSTANSGSCTPCAAGTYSGVTASTCTACSPGTAQPLARQRSCNTCEAGKYQSQVGRTSCVTCGTGLSVTTGRAKCEGILVYSPRARSVSYRHLLQTSHPLSSLGQQLLWWWNSVIQRLATLW